MDKAVDEICRSLEEESHKWEITTWTIRKYNTKTEYWIGLGGPITEIWNGSNRDKVFTWEQGTRIRSALKLCESKQASVSQQRILDEMAPRVEQPTDQQKSLWDKVKEWANGIR